VVEKKWDGRVEEGACDDGGNKEGGEMREGGKIVRRWGHICEGGGERKGGPVYMYFWGQSEYHTQEQRTLARGGRMTRRGTR